MAVSYQNWSGAYTYSAPHSVHPASLDELRRIVAAAPKVHAVGSRHCYNGIADSPVMISLDRMPMTVEIDRAAMTVTVNGAMRYIELARELEAAGLALHNTASLPHVTVAGAVATATHGSGDRNKNLASAVAGLEFVTSDGEIAWVARDDADFEGMVVHLGALGVVTRVALDIQPSFRMRQDVFLDLAWDTVYEQFDDIFGGAYSVSIFTDYGATANQLWIKQRLPSGDDGKQVASVFGARLAPVQMHPAHHRDSFACTEQLGIPGPWSERLPHFHPGGIGDTGEEMQAEYIVAREHAVAAIRTLRSLSELTAPYMLIAEVRTVAADSLWLSSSYRQDSVCLHYTFVRDFEIPKKVLPVIEEALAPFQPRPHWGKLFAGTAADLAPRYPRIDDFRALADRLDPRGAFRNAFLAEKVFGA